MSAKRKHLQNSSRAGCPSVSANSRRQLAQARQAHAKGMMCMEDYIRTAVQCYAADLRNGHKSANRFA